jgi:protein-disulfide isomerase
MIRILVASSALLALSACNQGTGNNTSVSAPVAAAKPPAGQSWVDVVALTPEGGIVQGNPNAPVKLVEYGSRACPVCARFAAEGMPALRTGPIAQGKLSYEFRDYPVHGALDLAPIVLGKCADLGAQWPIIDQMMENQTTLLANERTASAAVQQLQASNPAVTPAQIAGIYADQLGYLQFVTQRGVPEAKARACLADPKGYKDIEARFKTANDQFNVSGTPTFIINGNVVPNASSWDALLPALRAAGAM